MKKTWALTLGLAIFGLSSNAFAEWEITNKDANSYELVKSCGSNSDDWSIAGGVTKKLSIPAGATSCTITHKKSGTTCTVKDNERCLIQSGKIQKS